MSRLFEINQPFNFPVPEPPKPKHWYEFDDMTAIITVEEYEKLKRLRKHEDIIVLYKTSGKLRDMKDNLVDDTLYADTLFIPLFNFTTNKSY